MCNLTSMESEVKHRIKIVIHGSGSAMSVEQEGKITLTRTIGSGRLWTESAMNGSMGPLSLAYCQLNYKVLSESTKLQPRS